MSIWTVPDLVKTVTIVGHGPSLKGAGLGKLIDSSDKVVRLKGAQTVLWTNDFGQKADALCSSTEIMGTFFQMNATEYWAYPKNGDFDKKTAMKALLHLQKPLMIPLAFSNHWRNYFQQMGAYHPNVSTGTAAILFSIHRWKPEKIYLAGFDTLLNPEVKFSRHPDVPRSGAGDFPRHDWKKENQLLQVLRETYKVEIEDICKLKSGE